MHDVRPEQYPSVVRDLIRHEDDVTNHRLMWLLIVQGLLANAYVSVRVGDRRAANGIAITGILVTLSAFVALYKSYQARGYAHFLGEEAKFGRLQEKCLSLDGWPSPRIKSWRKTDWFSPLLKKIEALLEPGLFLPAMIITTYMFLLLRRVVDLQFFMTLGMAVAASGLLLFLLTSVWVWSQQKDEEEPKNSPPK